jgi:predicted Zn-dependent peptidase
MDFLDFEETRSASGVPIFYKRLPRTVWPDLIHIRILIRAGARHDPVGKEGTAHFLEHISRRGTRNLPSHRDVHLVDFDFFQESLNALTDFDSTVFSAATSPGKLQTAMHLLRDMVFYPLISPEGVELERGVILQEYWDAMDNGRREAFLKNVRRDVYHDHRCGAFYDADGWEESILSIDAADLADFHRAHYHPGNIALVFTGDILDRKDVEDLRVGTDLFVGGTSAKEPTPKPAPWDPPPPRRTECKISSYTWFGTKDVKVTRIEAHRAVGRKARMQTVLLFRKILKEACAEIRGELGKNYFFDVNLETHRDHHFLHLQSSIAPEAAARVRESLFQVFEGFRNGGNLDRFRRAKVRMIERQLDFNVQTTANYAVDDLAAWDRIVPVRESRSIIAQMDYEEVCEFAREFTPDRTLWLEANP